MILGGKTLSTGYGGLKTLNNAYGYDWGEFVDGAYLGVDAWLYKGGTVSFNVNAEPGTSVPEPATMLLLGLGLVGIAGIRRKFRS